MSHFRVFGCICYVFIPDHLRTKMDKKVVRCIFVGYNSQRKGWRCCDPTTDRCYTSRNVVIDEASSCWSTQQVILLDSKKIEGMIEEKIREQKASVEEEPPSSTKVERHIQSPWQIGVHQRE